MRRIISTCHPDYSVAIRIAKGTLHGTVVYGYAVDTDSQERCPGDVGKEHQRSCSNDQDAIDQAIRQIVYKVEVAISPGHRRRSKSTGTVANNVMAGGIFTNNYHKIEHPEELSNPEWAPSTRRRTLSYFERRVLPKMDKYGIEISTEDMEAIKLDLIHEAVMSARSNRDRSQAESNLDPTLVRINLVYRNLAIRCPELPSRLEFAVNYCKVSQPEQAKYISHPVRLAIIERLVKDSRDINGSTNGLAMGAAMMMMCGLRTSEAAAPDYGDIVMRDTYISYAVTSQIEDGTKCNVLKTDNAYRIVVGTRLMLGLLQQRIQVLRGLGYTQDKIDHMPIAASYADPTRYPNPQAISAYGRQLLIDCGYDAGAMDDLDELMLTEPDLDANGQPMLDKSAYIMRRDWCTRACNICGMDPVDVDYILGHSNVMARAQDYTRPEVLQRLAAQLERCVLDLDTGDICSVIDISGSSGPEDRVLGPRGRYSIRNTTDQPIRLCADVTSLEPGDCIRITSSSIPADARVRSGAVDTPTQRAYRRIIISPDYWEGLYDQDRFMGSAAWRHVQR